jgi:hypothetical protein
MAVSWTVGVGTGPEGLFFLHPKENANVNVKMISRTASGSFFILTSLKERLNCIIDIVIYERGFVN